MTGNHKWQSAEDIRIEELIKSLQIEIDRNAALRTEIEKEVQRTADAYSCQTRFYEALKEIAALTPVDGIDAVSIARKAIQ